MTTGQILSAALIVAAQILVLFVWRWSRTPPEIARLQRQPGGIVVFRQPVDDPEYAITTRYAANGYEIQRWLAIATEYEIQDIEILRDPLPASGTSRAGGPGRGARGHVQ